MVGSLVLGVQATAAHHLPSVLLAVLALTPLAAAEAVTGVPVAAIGLTKARAAAERIMELLDTSPANAIAQGTACPSGPVTLRAEALTAGWADDAPTTTGLELDLPPGRTVAVVGPSGTGKTTALLTLAGLLPALAGSVSLNGMPLAALDPRELRRRVSYTAEDAHVFTTTVRENLRVAGPLASDDDLIAALDRAGLHDWYDRLPSGLDTVIGAGGSSASGDSRGPTAGLSGGERRRLLLARAFASRAEVLLLDEPTEHLDAQTADQLVKDILATGLTVVMVTHRLVGLDQFDEIITLKDGAAILA
jgi:ATP-binding cassette subfamily C protein CydC